MGKVTKYPHGTFCWMDSQSADVEKDKAFYQAVLGWQAHDIPIGEGQFYTMFQKNGGDVAGLGQAQDATIPSHWNAYVSVDDVDAITEKVKDLGGQVMMPPMDVFDNGRMAVITDPTGAALAFWQPKSHIGATLVNEDGALVWNELLTTDPEVAMTFFGKLLGWTFSKIEEIDYWIIHNNERMNGGIMQLAADWGDLPPHWMNYIHVDELDSVLKKVDANGGHLVHGPVDTSAGTFAIIASPSGAAFSVIQSNTVDEWVE
ncbi:MAG: VOC family protein [Phototrophicales bacterium]